jgi:hypothetical protein
MVKQKINITMIFRIIFAVWIFLWIFFLIRPDKDGQYASLLYLYAHGYNEKVSHIIGGQLSDLLIACGRDLPEGATYDIRGFEKFSIDEVRARYYLWPFRKESQDPQFIIVYGGAGNIPEGYAEYRSYPGAGKIFVKKDLI